MSDYVNMDDVFAEDVADGRLDPAEVDRRVQEMVSESRAYRLAEVRKEQGLTQTDVAQAMHVSQRRVSAIEHGELTRSELSTVASYVEALGGRVEVVADFGDRKLVLG